MDRQPEHPPAELPDALAGAWQQQMLACLQKLAEMLEDNRELLTVLGDENRQRILMELLTHPGGMRVGELAGAIGLSRPAVSHHLKTMREAGIIDRYKVGTKNFYYPSPNVEAWAKLSRLAGAAERIVREIARRDHDDTGCPYRRTE